MILTCEGCGANISERDTFWTSDDVMVCEECWSSCHGQMRPDPERPFVARCGARYATEADCADHETHCEAPRLLPFRQRITK